MTSSLVKLFGSVVAAWLLWTPAHATSSGSAVSISGEVVDTWCYFSGVMGGPDAVVGSAHHTCAIWCAAGGIPVGVLADDGTVYMVMKLEGAAPLEKGTSLLEIQSDRITANGIHYVRDGINYLIVEKVVSNDGIVNLTHEDYGVVPPFVIPKSERGEQ